ncbi:hypothetical protein OG746_26425 [Streptomyces sp. NBC_01016]|uniref:hypothetical protein n=1 Tax=Streptomyces sp. NBC_01016 TaxID=2903720 RepID=UPI0022556036|nr:hypothetical protein [Streptomyces sp. NBC_01016]MCX4832280.1 hypothetical protein [Streptomyces sp. NBC_01016]
MGAKVRDVVRDVVAEVAPDEVLLLDQLAPLDEGRVTRLFERRVRDMESHPEPYAEPHMDPRADSHTDPHMDPHTDPHMGSLECGHVDVTAPVTPVVWLALDEAARRTTCRAIDGRSRRRTPLLHHLFRRRPQAPPTIRSLTATQLDAVRRLVRDHARSARLGEDAAAALADAVTSRLSLELTDAG